MNKKYNFKYKNKNKIFMLTISLYRRKNCQVSLIKVSTFH